MGCFSLSCCPGGLTGCDQRGHVQPRDLPCLVERGGAGTQAVVVVVAVAGSAEGKHVVFPGAFSEAAERAAPVSPVVGRGVDDVWPAGEPDEVINRGISRGLPWVNPGLNNSPYFSQFWFGQATDPGSQNVAAFLNL